MPWSPLLYKKEILTDILSEMVDGKISTDQLFKIIMKRTLMVGTRSIKNTIKALETLGYIRLRGDGWFEVNVELCEKELLS